MKKIFIFLSILFISTYAQEGTSGETAPIESEVYFDLEHNPYLGNIEDFFWDRIIPDISESENHPNGFDGLPINCYEEKAPSSCFDQEDKIINDMSKTADDKKTPIIYISIELKSSSSTSSYDISFPSADQSSSSASSILITPTPAAISTVKFIFKEGSTIAKIPPYKALCLIQEKKYSVDGKKLEDIYTSKNARDNAIPKDGFELSDNNPKICSNNKESFKIQKNTSTGLKEVSIGISDYKDGGLFSLVGKIKRGKRDIWANILKIRIIPYKPQIKEFVFIELNGGSEDRKEWDPLTKDPDNSITVKSVLEHFNKVYKQAAVKANITIGREIDKYGNEIGDFVIDENKVITKDMEGKVFRKFEIDDIDLVKINMTQNYYSDDEEKMRNAAINYFAKYGDPQNNKSKYFHIVFAINKQRKIWNISRCIDEKNDRIDLTFCNGFRPEAEPDNVNYYITEDDCEKKDETTTTSESTPKRKSVKIKKDKNNHYHAFLEKEPGIYEKEPMNFAGCEVMYTDNSIPNLLNENAWAGGINHFWRKSYLQKVANKRRELNLSSTLIQIIDKDVQYKEHLPYGSIMFVKRSSGEIGQYTVVHELGHTFGLTDVVINHKENTNDLNIYGSIPKKNGTFETNLMSWASTLGPKIRYRDTPISCTGGKSIKLTVELNDKRKPCKKDEPCSKEYFKTSKEIGTTASTKHENQWECFRDCYRPEIITTNRLKYWMNNVVSVRKDYLEKLGINDVAGFVENECSYDPATEEEVSFATLVAKKTTIKQLLENYAPPPPIWMMQAFYTAKQMNVFFNPKDFAKYYPPIDLKKLGYTFNDLRDYYSVEQLATCFTPEDFKLNDVDLEDFVCAYKNKEELLLKAYTKEELEPYIDCLNPKKLGL